MKFIIPIDPQGGKMLPTVLNHIIEECLLGLFKQIKAINTMTLNYIAISIKHFIHKDIQSK